MKDKLILLNNLKEIRTKKNLSQGELAEMVGVSRNTISSIETGQYSPTAKLAYSICIILDKRFEEVFFFDGYTYTEPDSDEDASLPNKTIRRIREYMSSKGWNSEEILDFLIYLTKE